MIISPGRIMENGIIPQAGRAVELKKIGKKYCFIGLKRNTASSQDFWALKDVSLECFQGQVLGIIGRNGAGKTTLLNIISGILTPSAGNISVRGRVLGLFNLGVGFQDELTGKENIFLNGALLGATKKEIQNKLNAIIDFCELGDFINMPLGTYSQGMRLRLGFSIIANLDFDVLVMDEVLAVGDTLFQNKCFARLMDFKRSGKTLIITTQNMDLIERLSDKVALVEHGNLLFCGNPASAIERYRVLLSRERFFVGSGEGSAGLVYQTKRWADNKSTWGNELGSKEVIIESVKFLNRFSWKVKRVKSGSLFKIKVFLEIRNNIKEPHFGVAIFREDGVYCYGPNSAFDGYNLPVLKPGRGHFTLEFKKLFLAPGKYRVSIAVWDKNEVLPFNYQEGYYQLVITGDNCDGRLLNIPVTPKSQDTPDIKIFSVPQDQVENEAIKIGSVKLLDSAGEGKTTLFTNEPVSLRVNLRNLEVANANYSLWIGIYRDDNVYCQGFVIPVNGQSCLDLIFSEFPLLPGGYKVAVGIWNNHNHKFLVYNQCSYNFNMVFNRQDHGTVYLKHNWSWRLE